MRTIITDGDGVLLDWAGGYARYLIRLLGAPIAKPAFALEPHTCVEWASAAFGLSKEASIAEVRLFQISSDFGRLDPYPDVQEWLPRIVADFGVRLVLISSPGLSPVTGSLRRQNLLQLGDVFERVVLLEAGASKAAALQEYEPALWYDDHVPHVLAGHQLGHRSFHFDRLNYRDPSVPARVESWGDVHRWLGENPL